MTGKMSQRLVVDTDVARASGESEHPRACTCRKVLSEILHICHRVALDERAHSEWKRHASKFAITWLAMMTSKGKVIRLCNQQLPNLSKQVEAIRLSQTKRDDILKDRHLLEAALAMDGIVLSLDDKAKSACREASQQIQTLRKIAWVNPTDAGTIRWLKAGARNLPEHRLAP